MTTTDVGRLLILVWALESVFGVGITLMNLYDAVQVKRLADRDPTVTRAECSIARAHVMREALRAVVAFIFVSIALYTLAQLLGLVPSMSGVLIALGLVIANGIIVINSANDRRLRAQLRRRITNGSK